MNEDPDRFRWENLPGAILAGGGLLFCALPLFLLSIVLLWFSFLVIFG